MSLGGIYRPIDVRGGYRTELAPEWHPLYYEYYRLEFLGDGRQLDLHQFP